MLPVTLLMHIAHQSFFTVEVTQQARLGIRCVHGYESVADTCKTIITFAVHRAERNPQGMQLTLYHRI